MHYKAVISLLGLLLLIISPGSAAEKSDTTQGVSQSVFEELSKEIEYTKTKKSLVPKKSEKEEKEIQFPESNPGFTFGSGGLFKALAYLLIAGLILTIFNLIFSGIKVKPRIDHSEIELSEIENIEEIDAVSGYEIALAEGNYRLALRMQFIKALQSLSAQEIIIWKPDKTNRHYIRETSGLAIHPTFRALSQTYEWVWYGNSAIGKETFDQLNPQFESFNQTDI